ncbi:MAG: hypothetical protein H7Y89_04105 [Steroidobacteraceae bacterium]|nr:hypothetical protein [Steroidobacteraceae bacterium]
MNTLIRSSVLIPLLAATASAQQPDACEPNVTVAQAIAAMGADIQVQPVFSPQGLKGWRLYWSGARERLDSRGIKVGSLMTHVCGVVAHDVEASGLSVNCSAIASCQIEVTFQVNKAERKVLLKRADVTSTS